MNALKAAPILLAVLLLAACSSRPLPTATPKVTATPAPAATPVSPTPSTPWVVVAKAAFPVELAISPQQQADGLSKRSSLTPGTGMLFPFEKSGYYGFWMKDMLIPLDLVWITPDCRIDSVTANVPAPAQGTSDTALPTYKSKQPIRYVLEINAAEAQTHGIVEGAPVAFRGSALQPYGCQ